MLRSGMCALQGGCPLALFLGREGTRAVHCVLLCATHMPCLVAPAHARSRCQPAPALASRPAASRPAGGSRAAIRPCGAFEAGQGEGAPKRSVRTFQRPRRPHLAPPPPPPLPAPSPCAPAAGAGATAGGMAARARRPRKRAVGWGRGPPALGPVPPSTPSVLLPSVCGAGAASCGSRLGGLQLSGLQSNPPFWDIPSQHHRTDTAASQRPGSPQAKSPPCAAPPPSLPSRLHAKP